MPSLMKTGRYNGEISQDYMRRLSRSGRTRRALNIHENS